MKLGVFTPLYYDRSLEEALDLLAGLGVEAVEIGTGNWPGDKHCDVDALLADPAKTRAYREAIESRGMVISALSQHGNPVHPDAERAAHDHGVWEKTLRLAVVPPGHPQGYLDCFEAFVRDVYAGVGGELPEGTPTIADGVEAARITDAVLDSSAGGGWLELADTEVAA